METNQSPPTPEEAAAALSEAQVSSRQLAAGLVLPSFFFGSIGVVIAAQIATGAVGVARQDLRGLLILGAGLAVFLLVGRVQLTRFRRLNGVWLAGLASRVVGGTGTIASVSYAATFGTAVWAAFVQAWWLVAVLSITGGAAYALSGRRWWRQYQADPQARSHSASAALLAVLALAALAGLLLLAQR